LAKTSALARLAPRRGRPRKFTAPSRAITLTLPDHVIDALTALDADLSRAVVRLAQPMLADRPHPPAELATFGRHSVIVVRPSRTLEARTGVVLVHMPDGRALLSFDAPLTIAGLELLLEDALEDKSLAPADREIFDAIGSILKSARRSDRVILLQRNIVVLETRRSAASIRPAASLRRIRQ
jgi:hypothetical protein